MIGSLLTRVLVMVFGYAYPAYECYKTVEQNKPEIEHLRFWCQYWILVALLTVCERIGDAFISWIPMYSEAKLAFIIYLWYPKTKGTSYVYDSFFRPYVAKHENDIDRNLLELRTRAGDIAVSYWQRAASYAQTRVFDILQYIASQSSPTPQPKQAKRTSQVPTALNRQNPAPSRQPSTTTSKPQTEEPSSTSSISSPQQNIEAEPVMATPQVPSQAPSANLNGQKLIGSSEVRDGSEAKQIDVVSLSSGDNADSNSVPMETVMDESIRVTRARARARNVRSVGTS